MYGGTPRKLWATMNVAMINRASAGAVPVSARPSHRWIAQREWPEVPSRAPVGSVELLVVRGVLARKNSIVGLSAIDASRCPYKVR